MLTKTLPWHGVYIFPVIIFQWRRYWLCSSSWVWGLNPHYLAQFKLGYCLTFLSLFIAQDRDICFYPICAHSSHNVCEWTWGGYTHLKCTDHCYLTVLHGAVRERQIGHLSHYHKKGVLGRGSPTESMVATRSGGSPNPAQSISLWQYQYNWPACKVVTCITNQPIILVQDSLLTIIYFLCLIFKSFGLVQ